MASPRPLASGRDEVAELGRRGLAVDRRGKGQADCGAVLDDDERLARPVGATCLVRPEPRLREAGRRRLGDPREPPGRLVGDDLGQERQVVLAEQPERHLSHVRRI